MVREISAGAIIYRMEQGIPLYLLLHYAGGHWDFVKGHIEPGESEINTVTRETVEETGITELNILPNFRELARYFFRRGKSTVYKEVIFYAAETKQKEVKISHEHIGYIWLSYEDALRQLTFENAKTLLKRANALISKV